MKRIYLDNNATTRVREEVFDAMLPYFREEYGNASSVHSDGRVARRAIDEARANVARLIGAASPEEVIFTSGGTEADNLAIKGVVHALKAKGNHIITTSIEHHAVLNTCKFLEKEGCAVTYLDVDEYGRVSVEAVQKAMRKETVLITVMAANNETGSIEPIDAIGSLARERGITFHTDAVQAVGKMPVDVVRMKADLLSLSGHKIYGPKGVGALYVRKKTALTPLFHGGHHEMRKRAGTENVGSIVGLGKASELALKEVVTEARYLKELRDRLYRGVTERIEQVKLNGHPDERLPNTVNMSIRYVEGESIILNLDLEGISVSTGSACTSGSLEPSHVLTAMGVDPVDAQGSIRFSLSRENTKEEIEKVITVLPPIVKRLRAMSPLYDEKTK